jgi:hypothetical protein
LFDEGAALVHAQAERHKLQALGTIRTSERKIYVCDLTQEGRSLKKLAKLDHYGINASGNNSPSLLARNLALFDKCLAAYGKRHGLERA